MKKDKDLYLKKLPSSWEVNELGDMLKRITNGLTASQSVEPPGIPVTRIETISFGVVDFNRVRYVRDLDEDKKKRFLLKRGDILFSHINSDLHLGKTAVVSTDKHLLHGMNLLLLRTNKELLDPYYLHYLLNYYRYSGKFMEIAQHAVNQSSLNQKKIKSLQIPRAPFIEQKRIVEEIEKQFSRLDEAVAALKRIKANLKRYKASVLKAAVEGKLTEDWRKEHLPAPSSRLGKFYTYAILCNDDSIYIGHTDDIARRWKEHREGQGSEWTKEHKPVKIAHYEEYETRQEATDREKWFKTGFGRKWLKRELAAGRTRQAGNVEPTSKLLKRILTERRRKWEEEHPDKKYNEPFKPNTIKFKLPERWTLATIQQISDLVQYGSSSKTSEDLKGIPVLRMGNIFEGELLLNKLKYLPKDHNEFPDLLLHSNDLLFNRTNSPELVGKTAVYKNKPNPCSFASYLIRVRLNKDIDPNFISYYLNSMYGRMWIKSVVSQQVGQANVNGTKLQAVTVPLPPYKEQQEIIAEVENRFSIINDIDNHIDITLRRAERLRQSILAQAFSGKLNRLRN